MADTNHSAAQCYHRTLWRIGSAEMTISYSGTGELPKINSMRPESHLKFKIPFLHRPASCAKFTINS